MMKNNNNNCDKNVNNSNYFITIIIYVNLLPTNDYKNKK